MNRVSVAAAGGDQPKLSDYQRLDKIGEGSFFIYGLGFVISELFRNLWSRLQGPQSPDWPNGCYEENPLGKR